MTKSAHSYKISFVAKIHLRCVAQLGRALRSGRRGRRFKSCRIDKKQSPEGGCFLSIYQASRLRPQSVPNAVRAQRAHEVRGTSALGRPERSGDRRFKSCRIDKKQSPEGGCFLSIYQASRLRPQSVPNATLILLFDILLTYVIMGTAVLEQRMGNGKG